MSAKEVISKDVKCPWCGAEPGEDCTEGSSYPPFVRSLRDRGHLARTVAAPPAPTEEAAT